jgi:hypothetical protein
VSEYDLVTIRDAQERKSKEYKQRFEHRRVVKVSNLEAHRCLANASRCQSFLKRTHNPRKTQADAIDSRVPWRSHETPLPPAAGARAPPTALLKIDSFAWCNVLNVCFHACLCGPKCVFRCFDRPSWPSGLFIALSRAVSGVIGIMSFIEGKNNVIRKAEGVK